MFKHLKTKSFSIAVLLTGFFVATGNAFAMDWTGVTMDLTDVNSYYALAIPALIVLWGLRKVVKSANRT